MEITTPTPPKVREPRPAKVDRMGNAMPERRKAAVPAARPAHARQKTGPERVVIGRDGKVRPGTGKPVRRINRGKKRS
jgi:ATP-dependent RNA helicase RhlE